MQRIISLIAIAAISLQVLGQKTIVCYEYKIQYNNLLKKDSTRTLIAKVYYNENMQEVKKVLFGPIKGDSCFTIWLYDIHSNLVKEITECSDKKITNSYIRRYEYDKNANIIKEVFKMDIPFFEYAVTSYMGDSIVKKGYKNREDLARSFFDYKDVNLYSSNKKIKFSYKVNSKGDTLMSHQYLYFSLLDTLKMRSPEEAFVVAETKAKSVDVVFLNNFKEDGIVDYYEDGVYKGSKIRKYNLQNKIILEYYYNKAKDKITSEVTYTYDVTGALLEKVDENFEDQLKKVYTYNNKKLVREDYVYGSTLDHSILHVY